MIKFLILCIIFFLTYLGFSALSELDSNAYLTFYNYQIETTIFTLSACFLLFLFVSFLILRFIFLFFGLPGLIKKSWQQKKIKNINNKLLKALSELLIGNKEKSLTITKKLLSDIDDDKQDVTNFILSEAEKKIDKKIFYLRNIINKKNYSVYATKSLALIYFNNADYKDAEECATKAFNENDTDTELMLLLIRIYAKQNLWTKMVFIVSKLQRANVKLLTEEAEEIAKYYYIAAKDTIIAEEDGEAIKFLESALELKPDYIEALNLYAELNTNIQNTAEVLKVLKTAFSAKPCFEIAEMYIESSHSSINVIYGTLASIVPPKNYNGLFLAIAAYLNLPEKIQELRDPKLISYEENNKNKDNG
ncbi:MAG: hypothetical protein HRU35_04390 [Rickettsiaceae bacterium]|nr:hypothetical protein [Rickettsiaceae bacterium]